MPKRNGKLMAGIAAAVLVVLPWLVVAGAYAFFEPSTAQWTLIVTTAAVATEAALWLGAAVLGVAAIAKLRRRLHGVMKFRRK